MIGAIEYTLFLVAAGPQSLVTTNIERSPVFVSIHGTLPAKVSPLSLSLSLSLDLAV